MCIRDRFPSGSLAWLRDAWHDGRLTPLVSNETVIDELDHRLIGHKGSKPAVVPCIPEPGKAAGWEQQRRKRHVGIKYHPHLAVSRPLHGVMHILLCDAQIGKPFPHLVRTALPSLRSLLQTNRLKNYEVTLAAHFIVFRVRKILYHRLGQSNLVLGRLLCQHSVSFPRSHIHYNKETMSPY